MGLTFKQARALNYIRNYIREHHCSPTFREIMTHLGYKSKGSAARLLQELEERGHITKERYTARSVTLITETCPHCGGLLNGISTSDITDQREGLLREAGRRGSS